MKAKITLLSLFLLATTGISFTEPIASNAARASEAGQDYAKLASKKGSEFDRAFLQHMTNRHKNAIKLANLALKNAEHQEVKNLAKKIRANRANEIKKMQEWQKKWGYARQVARQTPKSKPPTRHTRAEA